MKGKRIFAALLAATLVFACFAVGCKKEQQHRVGDYVQMKRHELDNEENKDKTVVYLYIDPLGDVRELQNDTLYFVAEYEGDYILRYLVYDRGFEIEMTDTVVTVLPAEAE
ncbi:MAG: hypothetical protein DBX59_12205 [Bacillota bacterium]|nr:MAG: hypothetical protein DBX59_12205 [Bacillota bacterium]